MFARPDEQSDIPLWNTVCLNVHKSKQVCEAKAAMQINPEAFHDALKIAALTMQLSRKIKATFIKAEPWEHSFSQGATVWKWFTKTLMPWTPKLTQQPPNLNWPLRRRIVLRIERLGDLFGVLKFNSKMF